MLATSSSACFGLEPHAAANDDKLTMHTSDAATRAAGRRGPERFRERDVFMRASSLFTSGKSKVDPNEAHDDRIVLSSG
jgi:hypothetical protein